MDHCNHATGSVLKFMRSVSTLPENLMTLIKKSNMEINLVNGTLKAGDPKRDVFDPVLGS